jgi:hypothetical protein
MTTASTSSVLDHTSDAGFRAWVAEIITQLVTTCGVTQTTDTGQINTSTVTRPAINTAGGYVILKFNDTLQATAPVFIKLEFGTANAAANPNMWITVGTGSNGSGTITGTAITARSAVCNGSAPTSTSTSYTSRYVYNSTYGVLGLAWKQNGNGTAGAGGFVGGFYAFRSNDSTGASTGDSINTIANAVIATSTTSGCGFMQCLSTLTTTVYPVTPANANQWSAGTAAYPFALTSSTYAGNSYIAPVFYMTPVLSISAFCGVALTAEAAIGSTVSSALVGSTALTFLGVGSPFGSGTYLGAPIVTGTGFLYLWQ